MSHSRSLIESLAHERHAERYRAARSRARTALEAPARPRLGRRALEMTRDRAGWLLVGVGLRLVAGRGDAARRGKVARSAEMAGSSEACGGSGARTASLLGQ